jgi:hypothetical protein
MNITEAQQFRELLLRVKALELERADILRRLDGLEEHPAVSIPPIVKRGPGRPRKNGN